METGLWKQFDRIVVFDTETTGIEFGRDEIIELWNREGGALPRAERRLRVVEDPTDGMVEGVDYFTPSQLARRLGISCIRLHRFLQERNICRMEKHQWVAHKPYASWQIDVPYRRTMPQSGKRWAFGRRKRWTRLGCEKIEALWAEHTSQLQEAASRGKRQRREPGQAVPEGVEYFTPREVACTLGTSVIRLHRFLESQGICRFEQRQWRAVGRHTSLQVDVPYYWTNPKTNKRWAFGSRRYWTREGLEYIASLWREANARGEAPQSHD